MSPKIGDPCWVFDSNYRVYPKGERSGPIYREHFRKMTLAGETRTSWLAYGRRFDKRTNLPRGDAFGCGRIYFTAQEVEDAIWTDGHAWRVAESVQRCRDAATLRKVAALVGYKP